MNVLVDTSVWSLALRRRPGDLSVAERSAAVELTELIKEGRAQILGPIRQELLSGIKEPVQYEKLCATLRSFPDEQLNTVDYEAAAKASNECRSRGVTVSAVDILICTVPIARGWSLFSTDTDFKNYGAILPIKLHAPRK
ncbi:MAG: PIN domain-containing protein [Candidatus Acidiferrales bacterium]